MQTHTDLCIYSTRYIDAQIYMHMKEFIRGSYRACILPLAWIAVHKLIHAVCVVQKRMLSSRQPTLTLTSCP